jgi:hypothetical protein
MLCSTILLARSIFETASTYLTHQPAKARGSVKPGCSEGEPQEKVAIRYRARVAGDRLQLLIANWSISMKINGIVWAVARVAGFEIFSALVLGLAPQALR